MALVVLLGVWRALFAYLRMDVMLPILFLVTVVVGGIALVSAVADRLPRREKRKQGPFERGLPVVAMMGAGLPVLGYAWVPWLSQFAVLGDAWVPFLAGVVPGLVILAHGWVGGLIGRRLDRFRQDRKDG